MSTKTRNLSNIDGANVGNPDMNDFTSSSFESYIDDAAFEADHGVGQAGDIYWNTTFRCIREHNGTAWQFDKTIYATQTDSTTTGSNQDVTPNTFQQNIRYTHGSLTSIRSIVPTNQHVVSLINGQASQSITLVNESAGATAANRIVTGTNSDFTLIPGQIVTLIYDEVGLRWRIAGGAASGSTDVTNINYINDPGAENTASGQQPTQVSLYNDGATATPVDGTGGVSAGITFLATATTPIRGSQSFEFTKDAANRQGNGAAFAITIANPDKGVVCGVELEMVTSANYVAGDLVFYVYDVTNSVLVTPRSVSLPKLDSYGKFFSDFGFTTGTSYRIIFHVATTSALAYTVKFDTMKVSTTRTAVPGPIVGNEQTFTPVTQGFGTLASHQVQSRVVGTLQHISGRFIVGTTTAVEARFNLPYGTIAQINGSNNPYFVGRWTRNNGNANVRKTGVVIATPGNSYLTFGSDDYTTALSAFSNLNGNAVVDNGDALSFNGELDIPINELVGSGSNFGPGAQIEYAYNTDVSATASVTASGFSQGPSGIAISASWAVGTAYTRRVRFQYPRQSDEIVEVCFIDAGLGSIVNASDRGFARNFQGTKAYGVHIAPVSGSPTDFDITFNDGGYAASNPTYAQNGSAWSALNASFSWVARKAKASSPVGFGQVTATDQGLQRAINSQTKIRLNTGNGYGSTNTVIRRFTNAVVNSGSGITYADSATLGASFTCTEAGIYSFHYDDGFSAASNFGISLNSSQLTTAINSITAADRLVMTTTPAASSFSCVSVTLALSVGDVVRPHGDAVTESIVPARVHFTVQRVG